MRGQSHLSYVLWAMPYLVSTGVNAEVALQETDCGRRDRRINSKRTCDVPVLGSAPSAETDVLRRMCVRRANNHRNAQQKIFSAPLSSMVATELSDSAAANCALLPTVAVFDAACAAGMTLQAKTPSTAAAR